MRQYNCTSNTLSILCNALLLLGENTVDGAHLLLVLFPYKRSETSVDMAKLFLVVYSLLSFRVDRVIRRWWWLWERDTKRRWGGNGYARTLAERFVKRATDKSFEGKRTAARFLPFLFSARCLPYGRFDLYIGVLITIDFSTGAGEPDERTSLHCRARSLSRSFRCIRARTASESVLRMGRAGAIFGASTIGVREVHKSFLEHWNVNALNFPVVVPCTRFIAKNNWVTLCAIAGYGNLDSSILLPTINVKPLSLLQCVFRAHLYTYIFRVPGFYVIISS